MESYVTLLEEKIRLLEENQSTNAAIGEERASTSHQTLNPQEPATVVPLPLSPSSLNDGIHLENSDAFGLFEFGITLNHLINGLR
jgi:hypothetical protein